MWFFFSPLTSKPQPRAPMKKSNSCTESHPCQKKTRDLIVPFLDFTLSLVLIKTQEAITHPYFPNMGQSISLTKIWCIILAWLLVMWVEKVFKESIAAQELTTQPMLEIFHLDNQTELHPLICKVMRPGLSTLSSISYLADFLPAPNRRLVRLSHLCQHFSRKIIWRNYFLNM